MSTHLTNPTEPNHLSSPSLNISPSFESALATSLSQVCQATGWDYGEVWIPSPERAILELSPIWYRNTSEARGCSLALEQFRLCSEGFIFPPGVGLPGRVWLSQQPEWIDDASAQSETFFLRNQIAIAFGIKAGYGVPILAHQEVQAVIVFFIAENYQDNRQRVELAQVVAVELGKLFDG